MTGRVCFGLDFGTSNSTLAIAAGEAVQMMALEGAAETLPSAVFWPDERAPLQFGRAAMAAYLAGDEGRLLRGLKSTLGSTIYGDKTLLGGRMVGFSTILQAFFDHLAGHLARAQGAADLGGVVLGRPVHFHDADPAADARAEAALAELARAAGIGPIAFQLEPIAAAMVYEQTLSREALVLSVDIGGGTSDFSILRLSPQRARALDRGGDILATGGLRLGGTDFDRALSLDLVMPQFGYKASTKGGAGVMPNHYFLDLATWHKINALYVPRTHSDIKALRHMIDRPELLDRLAKVIEGRAGHAIALRVEAAKVALSDGAAARIMLADLGGGPNPMATAAGFASASAAHLARIEGVMLATLARAGLTPAQITSVFLTGGAAHMPPLRAMIARHFDAGSIATGDMLGSVGAGLARDAQRRFG